MSPSRSKVEPPQAGQVSPSGRNSSGAVRTRRRRRRYRRQLPHDRRGPESTTPRRRPCSRQQGSARPGALARDAPVRAVGDHAEDSIAPPRRYPAHLVVDGVDGCLAQGRGRMSGRFPLCALERAIHGDEPLRGRQENDRVVAAPAVWIGVMERFAVPEASALFEGSLHVRVRVEDALPAEQLDVLKEVTSGPDGRVDLEPYLTPVLKSSLP